MCLPTFLDLWVPFSIAFGYYVENMFGGKRSTWMCPVDLRSVWCQSCWRTVHLGWMSFWFPLQLFSEHYFPMKLERVDLFVVEVCFLSCDSPVLCTRSPFHSNTISLLCCVSNKSPIGYVSEHLSLSRHASHSRGALMPLFFPLSRRERSTLLQQGCFTSITCLASIFLWWCLPLPSPEKRFLIDSPSYEAWPRLAWTSKNYLLLSWMQSVNGLSWRKRFSPQTFVFLFMTVGANEALPSVVKCQNWIRSKSGMDLKSLSCCLHCSVKPQVSAV